jgi:hypothetical protein
VANTRTPASSLDVLFSVWPTGQYWVNVVRDIMGGFSVEGKPGIYTLRAATAIRRRERGTRAGGVYYDSASTKWVAQDR